ncbi:hypothetical protein KEM55_008440, partial [Ascosphaera atra]
MSFYSNQRLDPARDGSKSGIPSTSEARRSTMQAADAEASSSHDTKGKAPANEADGHQGEPVSPTFPRDLEQLMGTRRSRANRQGEFMTSNDARMGTPVKNETQHLKQEIQALKAMIGQQTQALPQLQRQARPTPEAPQAPWGLWADSSFPSMSPMGTFHSLKTANNPVEVDHQHYPKWDPKKVGVFYPDAPRSWGSHDRFTYQKTKYFRDVRAFVENIMGYTCRHPRSPLVEQMEDLLEGDTVEWYTNTVSDLRREAYYYDPCGIIKTWLQDLEEKFRLNPVRAQKKILETTYGPDNVREVKTVDSYVSEIRNALRGINNVVSEQNLVHTAWYNLDASYRNQVGLPASSTTIQEFVARTDRYRTLWEEEETPQLIPTVKHERPSRFRFPSRQSNLAGEEDTQTSDPGRGEAYNATEPTPETREFRALLKEVAAHQERMFDHLRRQAKDQRNAGRNNHPWDNKNPRKGQGMRWDFYPNKNAELDKQVDNRNPRSAHMALDKTPTEALDEEGPSECEIWASDSDSPGQE